MHKTQFSNYGFLSIFSHSRSIYIAPHQPHYRRCIHLSLSTPTRRVLPIRGESSQPPPSCLTRQPSHFTVHKCPVMRATRIHTSFALPFSRLLSRRTTWPQARCCVSSRMNPSYALPSTWLTPAHSEAAHHADHMYSSEQIVGTIVVLIDDPRLHSTSIHTAVVASLTARCSSIASLATTAGIFHITRPSSAVSAIASVATAAATSHVANISSAVFHNFHRRPTDADDDEAGSACAAISAHANMRLLRGMTWFALSPPISLCPLHFKPFTLANRRHPRHHTNNHYHHPHPLRSLSSTTRIMSAR